MKPFTLLRRWLPLTLIAAFLMATFVTASTSCVVVDKRSRRGQRSTVVQKKHRHRHCHRRGKRARVCHDHPHSHPHH